MNPIVVNRTEANLVRLARFFVGHGTIDQVVPLLHEVTPRPACITANGMSLVQDALSKGCVLFLVKAGGWQNDRFLRDGKPKPGRVWQRIPLQERTLVFSNAPLEFLLWALCEPVHTTPTPWDIRPELLTPADRLFFMLAFDAMRAETAAFHTLRYKSVFTDNALCRLAMPLDFTADDLSIPSFHDCFTGVQAAMLECLQPWLHTRWLKAERNKQLMSDWALFRRRGRAERAILTAFLAAAERFERRDLARFLVKTASTLLSQQNLKLAFWTGGLVGAGPNRLQERLDYQRSGLGIPIAMLTFKNWTDRSQGVGYFDDGYAASQLWKEEWEMQRGQQLNLIAERLLADLEPLRSRTSQPEEPR